MHFLLEKSLPRVNRGNKRFQMPNGNPFPRLLNSLFLTAHYDVVDMLNSSTNTYITAAYR